MSSFQPRGPRSLVWNLGLPYDDRVILETNGATVLSRRTFAALLAATATAGFAACSGRSDQTNPTDGSGSSGDAFPVTIKHALGEAVIKQKPERIATLGWSNHEVPLALGVVPVGMRKTTWGDDDSDGLMPWVKEKIDALGGQTPVLFDDTSGIPFEQVADTKPDVILAALSGITAEEYATLSKVAPVVAYPEAPWITTLEQMIDLDARGMGMAEQGRKLAEDLDKQIADVVGKYPDLKGKKVLFSWLNASDLSKISFYTTGDQRVAFLINKVGMVAPQVVTDESAKAAAFSVEIPAENSDRFDDVDLLITYAPNDPAPLRDAMKASPLIARIPAVAADRVVFLGQDPLGNSATPSPLSIPWGLDTYIAKLAEGLK